MCLSLLAISAPAIQAPSAREIRVPKTTTGGIHLQGAPAKLSSAKIRNNKKRPCSGGLPCYWSACSACSARMATVYKKFSVEIFNEEDKRRAVVMSLLATNGKIANRAVCDALGVDIWLVQCLPKDVPRVMKTKFPATVMVFGVVSSEGDVMPPTSSPRASGSRPTTTSTS